ncbi:hypothetical protein B9Z55_004365 [Caenorhabditis nigoni]|nr:hypothetical protein B9Z55_004365 [Caenorhabditis nigoni]
MLEEFRPGLYHIIRRPEDPLEGKEKELIQLLIDNSNNKLRMYGSAEELLENVNIYKDFPGNHKLFSRISEPYPFSPKTFTSLKNDEKYIAKSDVFVILQNMIFGIAIPKPVEVTKMLNFYIKCREENAGFEQMEFVKFDDGIFEKMQKRLEEEFSKTQFLPAEYQQHIEEFSRLSKEEIFGKFKAFLPHTLDFNQNWEFENFLKTLLNFSQSVEPSTEEIVKYYIACNHPIKALGTIIDENPDMFLPIREDSDQPLTLRVFEDGDQKFLMEDEVFETDFDENSIYLFIITMEEVLENCDIQDVEFIRYPITRTKHRATPIQGPSGKLFILAIDYFFEFLRDLIHGKKIFQRLKPADLPNFLDNLNGIFQFLYRNEDIHFIRTDTILSLDDIDDRLSFSYSTRDVSDVNPSGFTVQDLKNELDHLGLTKNFPEIQNYAEKVYSEVGKNKKERFLRTCDLFDAVEHCQLMCILERLPMLKKFVHREKDQGYLTSLCYRKVTTNTGSIQLLVY